MISWRIRDFSLMVERSSQCSQRYNTSYTTGVFQAEKKLVRSARRQLQGLYWKKSEGRIFFPSVVLAPSLEVAYEPFVAGIHVKLSQGNVCVDQRTGCMKKSLSLQAKKRHHQDPTSVV